MPGSQVPRQLHMRVPLLCLEPEAMFHSTGLLADLLPEIIGSMPADCLAPLLLAGGLFCKVPREDERGIAICSRDGVANRLGRSPPRSSAIAEPEENSLAWDRDFGVAGTMSGPRGCVKTVGFPRKRGRSSGASLPLSSLSAWKSAAPSAS